MIPIAKISPGAHTSKDTKDTKDTRALEIDLGKYGCPDSSLSVWC